MEDKPGGNPMMLLQQDMNYEGDNGEVKRLVADLKSWHQEHPYPNGVDWAAQTYWAKMTDEDFLLFSIKHPNHTAKFRKVA